MIKIDVKSNIDEVMRGISLVPRRVEIAAQRALLQTARKIVEAERKEMSRVFDSPTPWTLNSFRVALGKEARQNGALRTVAGSALSAEVQVKDGYWYRAENFLQYQTEGASDRRQKAFEKALQSVGVLPQGWKAVPGERAKLDRFGNQSPGEIRQILSWFDAAERVAGSTQNMGMAGREKRIKGTKRKAGWEYFVIRPGDRRSFVRSNKKTGTNKAQPGVYRRTNLTMGSRIEPVMIFVRKAAYKPRFDFYGVARRTVDLEFKPAMDRALQIEINRGIT